MSPGWSAATRPSSSSSGDLIARIIAQTCRQTGLSIVYTELLDFDGDEIYFASIPELVGRTFGDALLAFEDSTLIGLRPAGADADAQPADGHRSSAAGDHLIVISEDDDTVRLASRDRARSTRPRSGRPRRPEVAPERTLDPRLEPAGADDHPRARRLRRARLGGRRRGRHPGRRGGHSTQLGPALANQTVTFDRADTTSRAVLDALDVGSFDHIVVLCYADSLETQRADSRTIITLLHLRDMRGARRPRLLDRVRDARPAQPRAGRGDPRRRLHRQRPAGQPADGPGRRERRTQCGLRRPVRPGRARRSTCDPPRLRRAGRRGDVRHHRRVGAAPERGRHRVPDAGDRRLPARHGVRINPPKSTRLTLGPRTRSSSWPSDRDRRLPPSADRRLDRGGVSASAAGRQDRDQPERDEAEADDQPPGDRDTGGIGGRAEGERRDQDRGARGERQPRPASVRRPGAAARAAATPSG